MHKRQEINPIKLYCILDNFRDIYIISEIQFMYQLNCATTENIKLGEGI